jgi:hypothetical protein
MEGLETRMESLEGRMTKLELKQEQMEDRLDEVYRGCHMWQFFFSNLMLFNWNLVYN